LTSKNVSVCAMPPTKPRGILNTERPTMQEKVNKAEQD